MSSGTPSSGSVPGAQLRVSDAERAQVADALSRHFAEGRLDQAEFDERMQRAMSAKTRSDLAGLFDDLPPLGTGVPATVEVGRRRRGSFALILVTMVIFLAAFSSAVWTWHFPWLLFAVIFLVFWFRSRRGWHRHGPWGWHGSNPGSDTSVESFGPAGTGGPDWLYRRRRRRWE